MSAPDENWLAIGVVGGPFGLAGEMKVKSLTDFPARFTVGKVVHVRHKPTQPPIERKIRSIRWHKGDALLRFEDCEKCEDAERYRGAELLVPNTERMELAQDQFYVQDLIGLDVYLESGKYLGKLDNVLHYAANDVYVVGKILIPAIKDVIVEIDTENRKMVIRHLPVLLPEDDDEN